MKDVVRETVTIDYTNYNGERREREIYPIRIYFGTSAWHQDAQWLLDALDLEKNARRTFAMRNIHSWK